MMYALKLLLAAFVAKLVAGNTLGGAWNRALKQTFFEQEIEDRNALHKIDNHLARRLIVMPLTDAFKPNQADLMHGKLQYGDKCSMPTSLGRLIFEKRYEVPWIFEIKPVRDPEALKLKKKADDLTKGIKAEDESSGDVAQREDAGTRGRQTNTDAVLSKAYCSPLDFRSPENYIFLPRWMMRALNLSPNDVVDVSLVRIKLAGLVVFQPLSLAWDDLMQKGGDPKSILERELNKYSSLTAGSTIYIEVGGREYPLLVKATYAEGGVEVRAVRVQDSDVNTDIDRSVLDRLRKEERESLVK
jgi:hypothetical protein